ncbi:unnamed protein product [Prorocentrum cordatum]|uniref:Uncharacterized protein n=1 Tax=Prorocentrum cordatum TaxID=2364126 RepID=A0ABN9VXL1_9DINO|nr:unnamed protein product [Polarella glacialis]
MARALSSHRAEMSATAVGARAGASASSSFKGFDRPLTASSLAAPSAFRVLEPASATPGTLKMRSSTDVRGRRSAKTAIHEVARVASKRPLAAFRRAAARLSA